MNYMIINCPYCKHHEKIPTDAFEVMPHHDYVVNCKCGNSYVLNLVEAQ